MMTSDFFSMLRAKGICSRKPARIRLYNAERFAIRGPEISSANTLVLEAGPHQTPETLIAAAPTCRGWNVKVHNLIEAACCGCCVGKQVAVYDTASKSTNNPTILTTLIDR